MLTNDPIDLLGEYLLRSNREPDGLLHPSGDLIGPLRHTMLRAAGAPERTVSEVGAMPITNLVRLWTGTMWHSTFENIFRGKPIMLEVNVTRYLPEGWAGSPDWILWSDQYKAFVLGDLKTIKGEGMAWIRREGIKEAHLWQLSAYWYALEAMGIPLVKTILVLYLPMNESEGAEPTLIEGRPLDRDLVLGVMNDRWTQTQKYIAGVKHARSQSQNQSPPPTYPLRLWINEHLAPVQEREQIVRWVKEKLHFEVKLAPNWSAAYCPYPPELCDCHEQGVTKIGQWEWQEVADHVNVVATHLPVYVPRKGYEDIEIEMPLTNSQIKKLKEAQPVDTAAK